jgi:hypothetical protein
MTDAPDANWVSLKDASLRAGVSISWLRKQYRHNGLPTRETVGPRGLQKAVPLDEVLARAAVFAETLVPGTAPPAGAVVLPLPPQPTTPDLTAVLLDRLFEAQSRAANAEAEAAYLLLRLDDAYAEIEQLRAQLDD